MVGKINLILRHIRAHVNLVVAPEGNPPEYRCQIAENGVGVLLALYVDVAGKARLGTTRPVRHLLIAVLRNGVQLPLIDHACINAGTHAVNLIQHQIVEYPGRVVGVGHFEATRPGAAVGARNRVVGVRDTYQFALRPAGHLRRATGKLAGIDLDIQ